MTDSRLEDLGEALKKMNPLKKLALDFSSYKTKAF